MFLSGEGQKLFQSEKTDVFSLNKPIWHFYAAGRVYKRQNDIKNCYY